MKLLSFLGGLTPQGIAAKVGIGFAGAALFVLSLWLLHASVSQLVRNTYMLGKNAGINEAALAQIEAERARAELTQDAVNQVRVETAAKIEAARTQTEIVQRDLRRALANAKDKNEKTDLCLSEPVYDFIYDGLRDKTPDQNRDRASTRANRNSRATEI